MLKKNSLIFVVVALLLLVVCAPATASTNGHTQAEAVAWINSMIGTAIDIDHAYGVQCVDLVNMYYSYLGQRIASIGYAYNLDNVSPPAGWQILNNSHAPQPGDIFVWDANQYGAAWTGHVGLITDVNDSTYTYVDYNSNGAGSGGTVHTKGKYEFTAVIRPDFQENVVVDPSFSFAVNDYYLFINDTTAQFGIKVYGTIEQATSMGCELYDDSGNLLGSCRENPYVYGDHLSHYYRFNCDPNESDICYLLSPGTSYRYRYCVWVGDRQYYSDFYSFTTTGSSKIYHVTFQDDRTGYQLSQSLHEGESGKAPGAILTEGYRFLKWSTDRNGNGRSLMAEDTFTTDQDLVLYGVWEQETYRIQYDANGGVNAPPEDRKLFDIPYFLSEQVPTRDGYTFCGWSVVKDADAWYQPGEAYVLEEDSTFYAVWKKTEPQENQAMEEHASQESYEAHLTASASSIQSDGTFSVVLGLEGNPGIAALTISSDFSSQGLTLVSAEVDGNASSAQIAGGSRISLMSAEDIQGDGPLIRLIFRSAQMQDINLRFDCDVAARDSGVNIHVSSTSVSVSASQRLPGDANNDGIVDIIDAMMVLRFDCGWSVSLETKNCDVNGDGTVDIVDAMLILRYDCGWNVTLL